MTVSSVLVVGGGIAGVSTVAELRKNGYAGALTLLSTAVKGSVTEYQGWDCHPAGVRECPHPVAACDRRTGSRPCLP